MLTFAADTSTLFSAIYFSGEPAKLLKAVVSNRARLLMSEYIRDELAGVILRKGLSLAPLEALLALENVRVVTDAAYRSKLRIEAAKRFERDRHDWPVFVFFLAITEYGQGEVLISSDRDLLSQSKGSPLYGKIKTPSQAVKMII